MAYKHFKKRTDAEQWDIDRPRIHALKSKVMQVRPGFADENYRDCIAEISHGRTDSSKELTSIERRSLINHLSVMAGEEQHSSPSFQPRRGPGGGGYPNRPRNMDKPGESRAEQLKKIEALLTIGKLPWSYADAIAKQMRLADKIAWVKETDLYKIITALRKKAQKEGWDLSGEEK